MMHLARRAAAPTLIATLLSTTALAAVPDNAGVVFSRTAGSMSPPEQLQGATLLGRSFAATEGRVVEIMMSDGTAIRLAPGSRLTIEDYSFDEAGHTREFVVRVDAGMVKITDSDRNGFDPIRVFTPAGVGELQGGGVIEVDADGVTTWNLVFGDSFNVTANGDTEEIYRPGFEVRTAPDADPDRARRDAEGQAMQVASALNPGLARAAEPVPDEEPIPEAGPADETPTQTFANLLELEEDRAEAEQEGATEDAVLAARRSFDSNLFSGTATVAALPPAGLPGAGTIGGSLGPGGSFGPNSGLATVNLSGDVASFSQAPIRVRPQEQDRGLTTQIIFSGKEASSQSLSDSNRPTRVIVPDQQDTSVELSLDLEYQFIVGDAPVVPAAIAIDDETVFPDEFDEGSEVNIDTLNAAFLFADRFDESGEGNTTIRIGSENVLQSKGATTFVPFIEPALGRNSLSVFTVANDGEIEAPIQVDSIIVGFRAENLENDDTNDDNVIVNDENFLAVHVRPALVIEQGRQDVAAAHASGQVSDERFLSFLGIEAADNQTVADLADLLEEALEELDPIEAIEDIDQLTDAQKERATDELSRTDRFFFAAGDVLNPQSVTDSSLGERSSIRYFLAPDLSPPDDQRRVAESIRAFLRNATAFRAENGSGGLNLADTGLLVIGVPENSVQSLLGRPDDEGDEQSAAIHVDFGIEGLGEASKLNQRSTISATIGEVAYGVDEGIPGLDDDQADDEVVLRGRTIGSTRQSGSGSVLVVGNVFDTAAGGGAEVDDQPLPGRATFFVLENFDPDQPETTGGVELPVGGSPGERFAILRLATAVEATQEDVVAEQATTFGGFAAALGEVAMAGVDVVQVRALTTGETEGGLSLQFSPSDNRVAADLTLIDQVDQNTQERHELVLGGLTGNDTRGASAFIDGERFGARTLNDSGADVAMVSGGLVMDGLDNLGPAEGADTREVLNRLASVDVPDLKWGFFFGDVINGDENPDGERKHVHLGSWVAGRIADPSRLPNNGKATYSGAAIGNVINGGSLYTQVGDYRNDWDFGERKGQTVLDFDGARMTGETMAASGSVRFKGPLAGGGRNASIAGAFVNSDRTGVTPPPPPGGQIGNFTVTGDNYGAAGTFAAKKD